MTVEIDSRWRDGKGVIHKMRHVFETGGYPSGPVRRRGFRPICGFPDVYFAHQKRCKLPVSCLICLGI